jgi:hypothetical protein
MRKATFLLVSGSLASLVLSQAALGNHAHPGNLGAKKITVALVPAFKQCTTGPTGTHGSPLASPSCQTTASSAQSDALTTGTGATFKGINSLAIETFCTDASAPPCPAAGDQEDMKLTASLTDVRCKAVIGGIAALCPNVNSVDGKDYAGEVQANATIRITDHLNTNSAMAGCDPTTSCSATVIDRPFAATGTCAATTADTTIGSSCSVTTTADALFPSSGGFVKEGKKESIEILELVVNDGGNDGLAGTAPNKVFARQGLYIP